MDTPLDSILKEQTDETTEAAANARLIAAAPDLLEAQRMSLAWADEFPGYREFPFIVAARAAIAKAEGRAA